MNLKIEIQANEPSRAFIHEKFCYMEYWQNETYFFEDFKLKCYEKIAEYLCFVTKKNQKDIFCEKLNYETPKHLSIIYVPHWALETIGMHCGLTMLFNRLPDDEEYFKKEIPTYVSKNIGH